MYQNIIYTDGGCHHNNIKDISKRKMFICFIDMQIKNHFQVRGSNHIGGSNNIAEILAIYEGMIYARINGYKNLLIRTDSEIAKHWIKTGKTSNKINDPKFTKEILDKITLLKNWFDEFEIQTVPRRMNLAGIILEEKTKGREMI